MHPAPSCAPASSPATRSIPTRSRAGPIRGTSLGLPALVEKLTWKTFQKTFYRDPRTGRLLGWNVRLEQDGLDAPSRPRLKTRRAA